MSAACNSDRTARTNRGRVDQMSDDLKASSGVLRTIQQKLADMKVADAMAQRHQETYIRYVVLANAGGIAACLSASGKMGGEKVGTLSSASLIGPLALYLVGVVTGAVIFSLLSKQATLQIEELSQEVTELLRGPGRIVPTPPKIFSNIERKGARNSDYGINVLGLVSQISFVIGSIWGLALISMSR